MKCIYVFSNRTELPFFKCTLLLECLTVIYVNATALTWCLGEHWELLEIWDQAQQGEKAAETLLSVLKYDIYLQ